MRARSLPSAPPLIDPPSLTLSHARPRHCSSPSQGQFNTAFSRFTQRDGLHIHALGRYAHFDDEQLIIHWDDIQRAIRVHPRGLVYWNSIGQLELPKYANELRNAEKDVAEIERVAQLARSSFGTHAGRTSDATAHGVQI